jgi:L-fuconolactonase
VTLVVDAHHHFWDTARRSYPWMGDELAAIRKPFGPDELRPLLARSGVDRTVLVQTVSSVDETREFLATAEATDFVSGVVGWVDLTDPDVGKTVAQLRASPGGRFLVGIRHQVHDEADPNWLLRDDVRRGIRAVGAAGLAYDLLVKTRELPAAVELVREFPELRFVLDHMAKPRIAAGRTDPDWEAAMAPLARCDNVHCKLSGLVTEANWTTWTKDDLAAYFRRALAWFGPARCMFGSDWPVCLLAAAYGQVLDALKHATDDLDETEKSAVFGANAIEVYRLV